MNLIKISEKTINLVCARLLLWFSDQKTEHPIAAVAMMRMITHIYQNHGMDRSYFDALADGEWKRTQEFMKEYEDMGCPEGTAEELQGLITRLETKEKD